MNDLQDEFQKRLDRAMPRIANALRNELVLTVPVDTGRLRSSIKVGYDGQTLIITMAEYGRFIELGCPPHVIVPKNKKALKFKAGGKNIFAKKINHPGSRPTPFIRNAIQLKLGNIIREELFK